jgi:hypothetical protein
MKGVIPSSAMNRWKAFLLALAALPVVSVWLPVRSQAPKFSASPAATQFFESRVRPVLAENCFRCHGTGKQKGNLRLDSLASLLTGGDRGPAIVRDRPEHSLLLRAIGYEDAELKMPPTRKLPRQQIADLTQWLRMGAPWPGSVTPRAPAPRKSEFTITERARRHWAFQQIKAPAVPPAKNQSWLANPIDAFVLSQLEAKGLAPNPPATKRELIRRVTYDLIGLPPTPAEVEAFVTDTSPEAYMALVERLLASPHYGEKWGRHWLDLVRFAETNSYERDDPKPEAWRYRDYVIRAFNQDKPYHRFLREQLAGDELPDRDDDALIATGYYRLGIWDDEPSDPLQARYDALDDLVATTGQVFLGLTLDCARCHDHKFDPIPQSDYYRLLAFFHNINPYRNGGATDLIPLASSPGEGKAAARALSVTEAGRGAPETFVLVRGNAHVRGDKVEPGFPQILGAPAPVITSPPGGRTTGRRRALADWIASPDNPLAARVLVNRIWQHHFGRGIVRTPNDFGLQGERPTHPELLDWLAGEFLRHGWQMKPLHRLIVTSNSYRMSSHGRADALARDPTNDLFWRFDMRRLSAEEVRDSILALSGVLSTKMYGPSVYPALPREVLETQSMPGKGWAKSPPEEQHRRSTYVHVKRSLLTPLLEVFDMAETDRSTPVRFTTTQATQALALLNSAFLHEQAGKFAARLQREAGAEVEKQVRLGLYLATARTPSASEIQRGVTFINTLRTRDGIPADGALRSFCLLVLNLDEFVYLD